MYGQSSLKLQAGFGYQEHFSSGITFSFLKTNSVSILYGSDAFYKPKNFSTLYFQYDRQIPLLTFGNYRTGIGARFGKSIYTDKYYRWKVISAVPLLMLDRQITDDMDIGVEAGLAISRIEEVSRISYGEIGKYKRYLPELKIRIRYKIFKLQRD